MVQCDWVIVCDHTFREELGKVCLIGVFDQVAVTNVPSTLRRMALAFRFSGPPGEHVSSSIRIVLPEGGFWFGEVSGEIRNTGTVEFNCNLSEFELPEFGVYSCCIYLGDEVAKSAEFSVVPIEQESQHQEATEHSCRQDHDQQKHS